MGTALLHIRLILAGLALGCSPAAHAAPSDVNVQGFYTSAVALQNKGMAAMFDKRTRPLMAQMKDAGTRARAENLAAKAAGSPLYCVPEGSKKGMGAQQVIAMLGRLPESERRSATLVEAWKKALTREYPCP